MAVLIVYPIKKAPDGNKVAPIKSPNTFTRTVHLGPSQIAQSIVGTKLKLILRIGAKKKKNLDKIISKANKIADSVKNSNEDIYDKIFNTLEKYIMDILPIKIEQGDEIAKEEYEKYLHTTIGKLDERDKIMQKVVLLSVSRKIFIHSLPLTATEKCYIKILKQVRELIVNSKNEIKRERAYETLFDVIEDYNIKILSTKVYWDNPNERQEYKKFWGKYEKVKENKEKKQILFLKEDIKKLKTNRKKYEKIIELHKQKLIKMGAMKKIPTSIKTYKKMVYNKRSA